MIRRSVSSLVAAGLAGLAWAAPVGEAPPSPPASVSGSIDALRQEMQRVFERARSAVVRIEGVDGHGPLAGSGFFVDPHGTLVTAYTIGGEAEGLTVEFGDRKHPARRLVADPRSGLALLKIEAQTPFLMSAPGPGLPELTSGVLLVGYPVDLDATPSFGIVAGHDRRYLGRYLSTTHLRANLPVQRGQGGSPLLNLKGEVIGVVMSSVDNGTACFALPVAAVDKVRENYVRFGEVRHGWLGLTVEEKAGSVAIAEIREESPAKGGGLRPGDRLERVGVREIRTPEDALDASFFLTSGDPVTVRVEREGESLDLALVPADPPGKPPLHAGDPAPFRGDALFMNSAVPR